MIGVVGFAHRITQKTATSNVTHKVAKGIFIQFIIE